MGREIRRVPLDWEHPTMAPLYESWKGNTWDWTGQGRYFRPLFDESFEDAVTEWREGKKQWAAGTHEDLRRDPTRAERMSYEDWNGSEPGDPSEYRPAWTPEEAAGYQVYETVSEGTPVSPVFATKDAMIDWLIASGRTPEAARAFAEGGWAPSFVSTPQTGLIALIDALPALNER